MKKKRILGILLSLAMMLTMIPGMTAFASSPGGDNSGIVIDNPVISVTSYNLYVGGTQVTSANAADILGDEDEGATASYDASTNTLTLDGANISGGSSDTNYAAIYSKGIDLTIKVTADSTVTGPDNSSGYSRGIYVLDNESSACSLTVDGTGSLTVNGGTAQNDSCGAHVNGNLTVKEGATLKAVGGATSSSKSYGAYASRGSINVAGMLNATGGNAKSSYGAYAYSSSSDSPGIINVSGTMISVGGTATDKSYGASASKDITVSGTMTATGGESTDGESYGAYAGNSISIKGTMTATGGKAKHDSYGTWSGTGMTVDGVLTATGKSCGVYESGKDNIIINGIMTADGGTTNSSCGIGAREDIYVIVNKGSELTAIGGSNAINSGYVKVQNYIAGTGWTNTEGTEGAAAIAINETGAKLTYKKVQFPPAHIHDFTYKASDATITATCSAEGCYLTDKKATLIIGAPTLTTYGQTGEDISAEATITDENSIKGDATIKYYKATKSEDTYTKTGNALSAAPTNAGNYVAEITLGSDNNTATASVGYTIAKADPTATAPSGLTATYGQTLADVTLTNPEGNTPGTWEWADAEATSVGNAGSNTFKANFTPTDTANYNTKNDVEVTIAVSAAATNTVTVDIEGWTYGETAKVPTSTATFGADTVVYTYSKEQAGTYTGDVPTNAGTWYVKASVAATENYAAGEAVKSFTISKANSTVTAPTPKTGLGYTASAQKLVNAGSATGGNIQYALGTGDTTAPTSEWKESVPTGTNAGGYYVWYRVKGDDNHNDTEAACVTVSIAQVSLSDATVNLNKTSSAYTGSEQSVSVSSVVLGEKTLTADTDYEVTSGTTGTGKGTYTVTVTGKGNYKNTATATWSITAATPAISTAPKASDITYGEKLSDSTLSDGVAKLGDMTVEGAFTWKSADTAPAVSDSQTTEYDVVFTPNDTANLNTISCKVKLTVNRADIKVYPTITGWTYGKYDVSENAPDLTSESTNPESGAVTYSYAAKESGKKDAELTYIETVPEDAGDYVVRAQVAQTANYNAGTGYADFTISKAQSSATITGLTDLTYNGSDQALVTEDGVVGGTVLYSLTGADEDDFTAGVPKKTAAGTYTVYWKIDESTNYIGSNGSVTASIGTKAMSVTAKGYEAVYDGKAHGVTVTVSEPNNATVMYGTKAGTYDMTTAPTYSDAGSYTVYYKVTAANYTDVIGSAIVKISKAGIEVYPSINSWIYGKYDAEKNAPTLSSESSNPGSGTVTYSYAAYESNKSSADLTYSKEIPTDAGDYVVRAQVAETANYNAGTGYANFTIYKAEAAVKNDPAAKELTYTGEAQALVEAGTADGGEMQYSLTGADYSVEIPTVADAGSYTVYYKVAADANHTDTTAKSVDVTIAKAVLTVTAKDNTINYGEAPAGAGVIYAGFVGDDTESVLGGALKYSFDYAKNGAPGTYTITPSGLTSDNYDITYKTGKLTVNNKVSVLAAKGVSKGKTKIKVTWNKIDGAASYEVWMSKCSKKMKKVMILSGTKTSFTKKKLKKNTAYKFYVVAKDASGKVISQSLAGHVLTGKFRGKYTNAKSLKVAQTSYTLSKGGSVKIKATQKKAKKGKKLLKHTALLRYRSDNPSVATVDANGTIKAVGSGVCTVYVQTVNGIWKTVDVTVK